MKRFAKISVIALLVLSLFVLPLQAAGTIKIGGIFPITGPIATFGISCANGAKMAVEEANARGGVLGSKIELIIEDDQYKLEEAANAAKKLIERDKVVAIVGGVTSSEALTIGPIAQNAKVVLVTGTATNPRVTQVGDFIFRVCFLDDFQGEVMANFAYKNLKAKTAAVLTAVTSDYSKGLADSFKKKYIALGGKIVADESYSEGDTDFRAQLTKIKASKPDFVFVPGYYSDVAPILNQARELGITVPFGGGDGWDSPELLKQAAKAAEGCFYTNHFTPDAKDLLVQTFVKNYTKKYGMAPDALAALKYDAMKFLLEGIKKAGTTDPVKIKEALASMKTFRGVTGSMTFDANRNAIKSAFILQIKGGKVVYYTIVKP